jgi:hypothetical protein
VPFSRRSVILFVFLMATLSPLAKADSQPAGYAELVKLFEGWRSFERPAMNGVLPDYSASAMAEKARALPEWQRRLAAINTAGWPIEKINDYKLVKAEMNGLDFNLRVLRPWSRDPAFYVSVWAVRSDCPLREGPLAYDAIDLYSYKFPLSKADQQTLTKRVGAIPALLAEAKTNLKDSNARDLWVWGEQELRDQAATLTSLEAGTLTVTTLEGSQRADLNGTSPELHAAVMNAHKATDDFIAWLVKLAPEKTGPSGVGKENYNWYEKNVHLIPFTWEDQVVLLHRELERAQAALRLEELNNQNLPTLDAVTDAASYDKMSRERLDKFVKFITTKPIIPDKPYLRGALEPQMGHYVPEDKRIFFTRITHREPMLLMSHEYHWIDLARMRDEPNPSPIRRLAPLSNIWDTRAEGFATAFEEIVMHAGLYDDNPRAKELVWMMLANRAARGLASLYVQSNEFTLEQAGTFHASWTPRGWAVAGDSLTGFEQLLYLRQPGYGASYVTGKILFDRLMAEYSRQQEIAGKPFVMRDFMDRFNNDGMIPVPLMEDEMIVKEAREP